MNAKRTDQGFTIAELIIAITVTMLFSGLIMGFVFNYWRGTASLQTSLNTYSERLNADDNLRTRLGTSSGLIIQNSLSDTHTLNADPLIASGLFWKPLHAIPGSVSVGGTGTTTPLVYYKAPSINTSKNVVMNGAQPYEDEFVLYLNGTTHQMLLRTLANPGATNNKAITSCPATLATSSCPADKVIVNDLDSVDVRYFSRSGNLIDWTSIWDPDINAYVGPDFPSVEAIEFNLHLSEDAILQGATKAVNQTVIRIAIRNV